MNLDTSQTVRYAARTDVGKIRAHNEDCYCINTDLCLFVVADGMGGHASGEVASDIAVSTIEQQVMQGCNLVEAVERAHIEILKGVETGLGKSGMGTTVVAVQLRDNKYTLAWVGDSRAYLWDEGISRLSKDHSMVQMLLDSGQITQAEARTHPRKNIIYQNLGAAAVKVPDVSIKQGFLYKDQMIVLCSDGLSDEVDDEQISDIIHRAYDIEEAAEKLVDAAIDNGGRDNISVIVIAAPVDAAEKSIADPSSLEASKDELIPDD